MMGAAGCSSGIRFECARRTSKSSKKSETTLPWAGDQYSPTTSRLYLLSSVADGGARRGEL
jgi:hypothetical protein